jgi:hypothetical protein
MDCGGRSECPRWSRADREPSEDWRNVLPIVNARTQAIEPGIITRIGSEGQRSSTIDRFISGPGRGIDSLHATIAEDLRTGSDHEVITWELFSHHEGNDPINQIPDDTPAWKLRPPIKNDDTDEFKEWQEFIYLFILSRLTSFSRCGYVDKF